MAPRVGSDEANRRPGCVEVRHMEDGDVELGIEQDDLAIEQASVGRGHADGPTVRPGDHVGVGDDVIASDGEPGADR